TAPAKIVSRGDFAAQYGASQADLDLVTDFARSHGMNILETSAAKRIVKVSGTVEQMNDAFGVKLCYYSSPTGPYLGRDGKIFLPQAVADVIEGIFGLDNRRMAHRRSREPSGTSPQRAK
ncbi:MAG: protease pro-enzyme activation domain-containing protein, partial [Candidatus Nitrosopolaris sp.]